jgi:hypothetical protein
MKFSNYRAFFTIVSLIAILSACKKEQTETCSDGIQNQSETGVDCGGPCGNACDTPKVQIPLICAGNLTESYLPLNTGNIWRYGNGTAGYDIKVTFKSTLKNKEYFNLQFISTSTKEILVRKDSSNNIVEYINVQNINTNEQMYIPANPVLNQEWDYYTTINNKGKRVVSSVSAKIISTKCTYENVIEIKEYNENGTLTDVIYFKKGLGIIQIGAVGKFILFDVTLK